MRSSAARDHPSVRRSQSPVRRRTRSQSADVAEDNVGANKRRGGRNSRQSSAESDQSNASKTSSRAGRTRKAVRGAAVSRDLSMVVEEDREPLEAEQDVNDHTHEEGDEGGQNEDKVGLPQHEGLLPRSQSPGAMSEMSGTTAVTNRTSHSQGILEDLDELMVEYLPSLFANSCTILKLLTPPNISGESISRIVRDLQIPDSRIAKRLRSDEIKFMSDRAHFPGDDYLNLTLVLRKLLGSPSPIAGKFRPDAIIQTANLASLVKGFLVTQRQSLQLGPLLHVLDTYFPEAFISRFHPDAAYGNSNMLEETFAVALNIRTQCAIYNLNAIRDQDEFDPDQVVANIFYAPLAERDNELSLLEDAQINGQVKDMMRTQQNTDDQDAQTRERINMIRSCFRQNDDAKAQGDVVDFELLEEYFPWITFLQKLVFWCKSRLDEIYRSVEQQGGEEEITEALIQYMQNNNSQAEVNYDLPLTKSKGRPKLGSPAPISRGVSGQSLYTKENLKRMKQLKKEKSSISSLGGPSSADTSRVTFTSNRTHQASAGPSEVRKGPKPTIGEVEPEQEIRPSQHYLKNWDASTNEKNKENLPLSGSIQRPIKRSMLDRQPDAQRIQWDESQESPPHPSRKRPRPEERESSEESEDTGFQVDQRIPDPQRRVAAPPATRRAPIQDPPSPKRSRPNDFDIEKARRRAQREARIEEEHLQASARAEAGDESSLMEENVLAEPRRNVSQSLGRMRAREPSEELLDEDIPAPTQFEINASARAAIARSKMNTVRPQRRVKWSQADTQLLIDSIEQWGCSWSFIEKRGSWDMERGQVALKDKARNLKVDFLIAGVPLPANFENVPLSVKERRRVQAVIPDWEE